MRRSLVEKAANSHLCRLQEDDLRDVVQVTGDDSKCHPGEDVGIVTLPGVVGLPSDSDRVKGAATRKDCMALRIGRKQQVRHNWKTGE